MGRASNSRTRRCSVVASVCALLLLTVAAAAPAAGQSDPYEPNDDIDEAAPIEDGHFTGLEIQNSDRDFFAIDVEAGEEITAEIEFADDDDGDLDLVLYDPDENNMDSSLSHSDDETVSAVANQDGTHYVEVYSFSSDSNTYNMTVASRFEPNDDPDAAADVGPGTYANLGIVNGEADYYAVDLEAGDEVTAEIEFVDDDGDLDLAILDSAEDELESSTSVSDDEQASVVADQSDTYYVVAYGFSDASNGYDMTLDVDPAETETPTATATPTDQPGGGDQVDSDQSASGSTDAAVQDADDDQAGGAEGDADPDPDGGQGGISTVTLVLGIVAGLAIGGLVAVVAFQRRS